MNKPDGITQDAWDRALTCVDLYLRDVDMSPQEAIAAAIKSAVEAERARCSDHMVRRAAEMYASATMTGQTMARIFEAEAAAIRNGT